MSMPAGIPSSTAPSSAATSAIAIRGVTKRFGSHTAVDDLTLTVPRGSVYGFIGPNGSGKTTTLRMIMNILLPDQGAITVLDQAQTQAAHDRVGYLPEERGLYRKMKVRRLLRYYGALKGADSALIEREIDFWLERLELAAWGQHRIEALSKGMSQKVQFIATIVSRPDLVILDEPFSGLDPVNATVLREAVLELRRRGTTIVFSTHDMSAAERLCDRIFMIFRGHKVLDGTLDEIQSAYGFDTVRVRTEGGRAALAGVPGVESIVDHGNLQEVRLIGNPQAFLQQLLSRTAVQHFEIARPSLHDIFVRIARPEEKLAAEKLADAQPTDVIGDARQGGR
jgi:ABC-2 type transport system ATP-binding protein